MDPVRFWISHIPPALKYAIVALRKAFADDAKDPHIIRTIPRRGSRANRAGAIIGALTGAAGLFLVQEYTDVHLLLYALVGISICCLVGYISSYAFPPAKKSMAGLKIHNPRNLGPTRKIFEEGPGRRNI
ncbi:hypothetical protein MYX75_02180 [Acidobacteria bacterium AH-259-A15]|nr:hypothetical protein [Acidobacteria bacterium AH-259-A15]